MLNTEQIKKQFPVLRKNPRLAYLDNGASCQTPEPVLEAMSTYYEDFRANIHRGQYLISEKATEAFENARVTVAKFINANPDEIVSTYGTTNGLNLLAYALCSKFGPGDNVVITRLEHHANLIPWQQMSKIYGFELRFIELRDYLVDLESAKKIIDKKTRLVSIAHVSNVLGTIAPVEELAAIAHSFGALSIIDAAQSIAHLPIDVKKIGCDALVFSGHKMYGPTGIGILYLARHLLEKMQPVFYGGGMITEVSFENSTWIDGPEKFEPGTPNIAGMIGLAASCDFLGELGWENILEHEKNLTKYALEKISEIKDLQIVGPRALSNGGGNLLRTGVLSFTLPNLHFHDVATILADQNVCVRAGHHCAMPLLRYLGVNGTTRASLGIYNTSADIDLLFQGIKEVQKTFFSLAR